MVHLILAQAAAAAAAASPSPSPAPSGGIGGFFSAIFSPLFGWIPTTIAWAINFINLGVHNLALSLIILAALITVLFWGLNVAQFKSMLGMQKIAPKMKALQNKYKSDPQKQQQMMMELYKSEGVNPLAGCWPTLVQLPVLFSVYYAVVMHRDVYEQAPFLWIGSALAAHSPVFLGVPIFAASLAHADLILIVIYMISQYLSMRFTTMPSADPAQAQQMKIMQVISPLMIGYFGLRANWPSAMVLYWLAYNVFRMGQMFYLIRRYHEPISFLDSDHVVTEDVAPAPETAKKKLPAGTNGAAKTYKVKKKTKGA